MNDFTLCIGVGLNGRRYMTHRSGEIEPGGQVVIVWEHEDALELLMVAYRGPAAWLRHVQIGQVEQIPFEEHRTGGFMLPEYQNWGREFGALVEAGEHITITLTRAQAC